jgi:hypothetical protein
MAVGCCDYRYVTVVRKMREKNSREKSKYLIHKLSEMDIIQAIAGVKRAALKKYTLVSD